MGIVSYSKEFQDLEEQGIDLIEVLGQDRHLDSPEALEKIVASLGRTGGSLYAELLQHLTCRRFQPGQAEAIWHAIMKHKSRMSHALGRKVSFRVAALDYLSTRNVLLRQVRLVAKPEFETLMTFVNVDDVTSVHNRRFFNERLSQELRRARRYGSHLSLLIIDVDDFKRVNDTLGHVEGDAALRRLGRMLRERTRETDVVARYGGDEFAVLLPETNSDEAHVLAERVRKSPVQLQMDGTEARVRRVPGTLHLVDASPSESAPPRLLTLSIGGATYPTDCDEADELVAVADQMCLDAKREGKDRVRMAASPRPRPMAAE